MLIERVIYTIHEKAFGIHKVSQKELAELAGVDEDSLIGFKENPMEWMLSQDRKLSTVLKLQQAAGRL